MIRYINLLTLVLVVGRCAWIFGALLRSRDLPLRLAQDDFYYYLKPAQNLAWHGESVAFQHVLTNGYHPLYFLLLTLVSFGVRTLPGIFRFLWVLDVLSATAIFLLTRRLFSRVGSLVLSNAFAVLLTGLCITQICNQMEVTLALPFGFAFLLVAFVPPAELTVRRSALLGLLGALTFLARLDAGLLVFFYLLGLLCSREYRAVLTWTKVATFAATCVPLPILYLWSNHHYFHTILPVSGMAKELRHGRALSFLLLSSFTGSNKLLLYLGVATIILAWVLRKKLDARERVLLFATSVTPFVFYGLDMEISDWKVWDWYFYVLRFSTAGFCIILCAIASRPAMFSGTARWKALLGKPAVAAVILCAALAKLMIAPYKPDKWMVEIQHASGVLDQFAAAHPGVYAMGDRAGMFMITTNNPVLQAEGLVMDRQYLEHIQSQDDLRSVLQGYGVNYYVAVVSAHDYSTRYSGSCFHAMEPSIAGPSSLRMRSDFCEAPVFQFPGSDGTYLIFQVQPA